MSDIPAFPRPAGDYNGSKHGNGAQTGMTLRDYFAAKVLQGIWSSPEILKTFEDGKEGEAISNVAYEVADAMLKERDK